MKTEVFLYDAGSESPANFTFLKFRNSDRARFPVLKEGFPRLLCSNLSCGKNVELKTPISTSSAEKRSKKTHSESLRWRAKSEDMSPEKEEGNVWKM